MPRTILAMPNGVRKVAPSGSIQKPKGRDFTTDQSKIAMRLATAFAGSQRKDKDILEKMLKKHGNLQPPAKDSPSTPYTTLSGSKTKASVVLQIRKDDDWEARALHGIEKKVLSLDKQWTEKTWHNKSSIHERLKLLKDDGVDIISLQAPKTSSESITHAVLARIAVRKHRATPQSNQKSKPFDRADSPHAPEEEENTLKPSDDPMFAHHLYRPLPTPSLKRKRSGAAVSQSAEVADFQSAVGDDEPAYKKRRTVDIRTPDRGVDMQVVKKMSEEEIPTYDLPKRKVLAEVFELVHTNPRPPHALVSQIIILKPSQEAKSEIPVDFLLNSKCYPHIMLELRALSDDPDGNNDKFIIRDPADPNCLIRVSTTAEETVLQSNLWALTGLLSRWKTKGNGLLYFARTEFFNVAGARTRTHWAFEFSNKTQAHLAKIADALIPDLRGGSVLYVRVIEPGESDPSWFGNREA